jgi:hypothetical protein
MPLNGTLTDKFNLNCLGSTDTEAASILCARIACANHDCDGNASHYYDETFNVKVLLSERDIQVGEEICISYTNFNDCSKSWTPESSRAILASKWDINCPGDCFCRQPQISQLLIRSKQLDEDIYTLASTTADSAAALRLVRELLSIHNDLHSSWISKARTYYDGFQVAIMRKSTLPEAKTFIDEVFAIKNSVLAPKSKEVKEAEKYAGNISLHRNYLIRER